jgi:hypothetical protein
MLTRRWEVPVVSSDEKFMIELAADLANWVRETARHEGRTASSIIEEALRVSREQRTICEYREIQNFWSRKASERGILTKRDLKRYLRN